MRPYEGQVSQAGDCVVERREYASPNFRGGMKSEPLFLQSPHRLRVTRPEFSQ